MLKARNHRSGLDDAYDLDAKRWSSVSGSEEFNALKEDTFAWSRADLPMITIVEQVKYPMIAAQNLRNVANAGYAIASNFAGEQLWFTTVVDRCGWETHNRQPIERSRSSQIKCSCAAGRGDIVQRNMVAQRHVRCSKWIEIAHREEVALRARLYHSPYLDADPHLAAGFVHRLLIIELPPGDWVTTYVSQLRTSGITLSDQKAQRLTQLYGFDQPT